MTASRAELGPGTHDTEALLLRRVDYGDSDLVLALFSEKLGRVSALARGARRSTKRFGGVLEPLHTLSVRFDEPRSGELFVLREARIVVPRTRLTSDLERMQAAGRALGWVRGAAPPRTREPEVWKILANLLDLLSEPEAGRATLHLCAAGLRLLAAFGWGLDLSRCVRCGRPCPADQSAMVDAARGGLVCRACGGARLKLPGQTRERLLEVAAGAEITLDADELTLALELVEQAMRAHAGLD